MGRASWLWAGYNRAMVRTGIEQGFGQGSVLGWA